MSPWTTPASLLRGQGCDLVPSLSCSLIGKGVLPTLLSKALMHQPPEIGNGGNQQPVLRGHHDHLAHQAIVGGGTIFDGYF